ncbi:efflux RND transporter periplasmic adaptor subunit [Sphingomonas flavalba]|uniref:efflux RND transporter periplasmic adaptor subunit n=1 Tax=Sphingomonas flavalba TaxID=2559804 RepID=UPI0039DF7748
MNMQGSVVRADAAPSSVGLRERVAGLAPWQRGGLALIIIALVVAAAMMLFDRPEATAAQAPPNVTVAQPLVREVSEWDDYVGRFAPSRTVEIRPRVSGAVTAVHFRDGEIVRKGQLLFTIDPRPFAAALAEARANVASARSAVALAQADLGRATRLIADEAVSAGEVDALRARVRASEAALAAAEARNRSRALDMEFTQVRAPIAGRISDRRVDAGNLVAGGEGTGGTLLTTINALNPIYFTFDASEALFLKARRNRDAGAAPAVVEIRLQDETDYRWKGTLDFTDNGLDPRSGTIRGRAVLNNPDYFLTPGMFGNMRLGSSGTVRALLVPDAAVQTDLARKTVLVVGADNGVVTRTVQVGAVVDGLRIIRSGLKQGDRVVIAGMQSAIPGQKVTPKAGRITPQAETVAPVVAPVAAQATLAAN